MSATDPAPYLVKSRFNDFDHFAESVEAWRLDFRQLDRGGFHAEVLQFGSASAQVGSARFGRRLHQRGDPPPGMRSLVIPMDEEQSFLWRGRQITGNTLMIFPEGGELESFSGPRSGSSRSRSVPRRSTGWPTPWSFPASTG